MNKIALFSKVYKRKRKKKVNLQCTKNLREFGAV